MLCHVIRIRRTINLYFLFVCLKSEMRIVKFCFVLSVLWLCGVFFMYIIIIHTQAKIQLLVSFCNIIFLNKRVDNRMTDFELFAGHKSMKKDSFKMILSPFQLSRNTYTTVFFCNNNSR